MEGRKIIKTETRYYLYINGGEIDIPEFVFTDAISAGRAAADYQITHDTWQVRVDSVELITYQYYDGHQTTVQGNPKEVYCRNY